MTEAEIRRERRRALRRDVKEVARHYLIAALWSSTDTDDTPLDSVYGIDDCAPELIKQAEDDCAQFIADSAHIGSRSWSDEQFGHDFWLTRNRHGAGFWDRGHGVAGERLSEIAHRMGSVDLYVGDDGKIHGQ